MAHEIEINDHMVSGNSIVPWHSLGTVVAGLMTAEQVLKEGKLSWKVLKKTLQVAGGKSFKDKFAIVREDTGEPLGVVGKIYTPIQNSEGLDILDPVIGKDAVYETAGSLRNGRIVWFLASLSKEYFVNGDKGEKMKQYFLVYLSHDGSKPVSVRFVSTRVVCMNTLSCAIGEAQALVTLRHTTNYADKLEEVHRIVGLADKHAQAYLKLYTQLSSQKLSLDGARNVAKALFPSKKETNKIQDKVIDLFQNGIATEGKTRADFLNAVTQYVTHEKTVRAKDPAAKAAARFDNSLFGYGLNVTDKAVELLLN
jgi:phage/plasmid-like protein (TIGR03299 family)